MARDLIDEFECGPAAELVKLSGEMLAPETGFGLPQIRIWIKRDLDFPLPAKVIEARPAVIRSRPRCF